MPALATLLIPLIPSMVTSLLSIIDAIRTHPDTPGIARAQLDAIAADLAAINARVQAVELPD